MLAIIQSGSCDNVVSEGGNTGPKKAKEGKITGFETDYID